MKRKETQLEKNLQEYYYKLAYKTYEGKNSEKVSGYVYQKKTNLTLYTVCLDKTREHIVSYAFSNSHYDYFDKGRIEGLQEVLDFLGKQLNDIYDFENKVARELPPFDVEDIENPFIEESNFDD